MAAASTDLYAQTPATPEALDAVAALVDLYRREAARDPDGLELELRFGTVRNGLAKPPGVRKAAPAAVAPAVAPGVPGALVHHVMGLVQTNPTIDVDDWAEATDCFFDVAVEGAGLVEHRSRTRYDTDTLSVHTTTVVKTKLGEAQLRSGSVALRAVLSREAAAPLVGRDTVRPKHVRLHQRRRVRYASHGFGPKPTWLIEVGMVWAGATKTEAETKQMNAETPMYTLELELLDPAYVVRHCDGFVAASLLMKAADFLRGEGAAEAVGGGVGVAGDGAAGEEPRFEVLRRG